MRHTEAQEIIEKFHQSILDLRPEAIVQPKNKLPYTSARIKFAHFVYGEYLIKEGFYIKGKSQEEILKSFKKNYQELMESYGLVESLFNENPEPINIEYRKYLEGLRNGLVVDFRIPNPFGECKSVSEYHNFFGECWFLEHKTNLFGDGPLAAFIYDVVYTKALKERDLKTLIDIVNTSLTRSTDYPRKTTNNKFI